MRHLLLHPEVDARIAARWIRRISKRWQRNSQLIERRALGVCAGRGFRFVTCGHTHLPLVAERTGCPTSTAARGPKPPRAPSWLWMVMRCAFRNGRKSNRKRLMRGKTRRPMRPRSSGPRSRPLADILWPPVADAGSSTNYSGPNGFGICSRHVPRYPRALALRTRFASPDVSKSPASGIIFRRYIRRARWPGRAPVSRRYRCSWDQRRAVT